MLPTLATQTPIPVHEPLPPRDQRPQRRRKLFVAERIKILLFLGAVLGYLVWRHKDEFPFLTWRQVIDEVIPKYQWLLWVIGAELLRQIHYVISETNAAYHHFWSYRVFGGWNRSLEKLHPWTQHRMGQLFNLACIAGLLYIGAPQWAFEVISSIPGIEVVIQVVVLLVINMSMFFGIFYFLSKGGYDVLLPGEVKERYEDVWGQDRVLEKVKETVALLEKPLEVERRGGHVPGGVLLYGPPGTGKTLMAKAVAGETGKPFVFVEPGAFQNMFMGVGILKMKALFRKVRKLALRHGGCILFFDEADSLGRRGGKIENERSNFEAAWTAHFSCNGMHYVDDDVANFIAVGLHHEHHTSAPVAASGSRLNGGWRQLIVPGGGGAGMGELQVLLTELSGLEKPRGLIWRNIRKIMNLPARRPPRYRILTMMATNSPDSLDPALMRPGRLDRKFRVGFPDLSGRKQTFRNYLDKTKHQVSDAQVERLALMSPSASGAMMKDIVNEAILSSKREGRDTVGWQDIIAARTLKVYDIADPVHPMALERHAVALHEASHAVAMYRLRRREFIDVATIEPRGPVGGFVAPVPKEEPGFPWRYSNEENVMTFLASLAGERMFFGGDNSVGVGGDMFASTSIVSSMLGRAAMGHTLASWSQDQVGQGVQSDRTRGKLDHGVEEKLQELYERTQALIGENRHWVMAVGHALEQHHTITGEDIEAIFEGRQGPLVDGSWYHSDEFRVAYEHYHAKALEAHQAQTPLTAPLPKPGQVLLIGSGLAVGTNGPVGALNGSAPQPIGLPAGTPHVEG